MSRMVRRLSQNALSDIQRRQEEVTIDEELKVEEGANGCLLNYPRLSLRNSIGRLVATARYLLLGEVEKSCINRLRALFPLKYARCMSACQ